MSDWMIACYRAGDLVKLWGGWGSHALTSRHNSMDVMDHIHAGELSLVLKVGLENVKLLSPRGKIGWIWKPRLERIK
jgi:hypothetical protein